MMKFLMISCKKATELMAKNEEAKLSLFQRFKLTLHVSMCSICNLFQQQTKQLIEECQHLKTEEILTDTAKQKMKEEIKKQYHGG